MDSFNQFKIKNSKLTSISSNVSNLVKKSNKRNQNNNIENSLMVNVDSNLNNEIELNSQLIQNNIISNIMNEEIQKIFLLKLVSNKKIGTDLDINNKYYNHLSILKKVIKHVIKS